MQQVSRFFQVPWMFKQQVPIELRADPFFPSPISAANPLDPLAQPGGNDKPATAQDQPHFNFPRWTPTARCQNCPW